MKLILFDIDGTLMDSGGAGAYAMEKAFKDILSIEKATRPPGGKVSMAGKTDRQILREVLSIHNIRHNEPTMDRLMDSYISHLTKGMDNDRKSLKPCVMETLDWLGGMPKAHIGLLTGNVARGAEIKLKSFGLWERFGAGAYGSDNEDRNKLLPAALERFKALTGDEITFSDCVVVGDTPRDVQCAKPYGAHVVAVATGPFGIDELRETEADVVISDLSGVRDALSPLLLPIR